MLRCFLNIFLLFLSITLVAQQDREPIPNTLVMGNIKNAKMVKEIHLVVNNRHIDQTESNYTSKVLDDGGRFAFAVEINYPQLVEISYARNKSVVYLEPNDTLYLEADANSFQYSLKFDGRSGYNNKMYREYVKKFPVEKNAFNIRQYKKGISWYRIDQRIDDMMIAYDQSEFLEKINQERLDKIREIDTYVYNQMGKLTEDFVNYLKAEIEYEWANHLLTYGYVFAGTKKIDHKEYLAVLGDVPLNSKQIGSAEYRKFLTTYINYLQQRDNTGEGINDYVAQYELARDSLLEEKSVGWSYFSSNLLMRGFKAAQKDHIMDQYKDFIEYNPAVEYDKQVIVEYQKAVRYDIGSPAPNFTLTDEAGKEVSLSDFKGKVVYLDFWASWCRPCMKKIDEQKSFRNGLKEKGVVFVHISLDRNENTWKEILAKRDFKGVHLLALNDIDSPVATAYNVNALPQYFIITKQGNFAAKPRSATLPELEKHLLALADR